MAHRFAESPFCVARPFLCVARPFLCVARPAMSDPFRQGDPCLLFDGKGRRYLIELIPGKEFHYHRGVLPHDDMIGAEEGTVFESSLGSRLIALRPRLADYMLKMGRGAQVVYPKDAAAMLMWADVGPGMTILEAGTGSGALTMALARAVLPGGRVVSVDAREDHAAHAKAKISGYFGGVPEHVDLRVGSVEDNISDVAPDRLILDLPEPWHVVEPAAHHLQSGGTFASYVPTIPQVQQVTTELKRVAKFIDLMTFEVLHREWAVEGRSVRPAHRMVGHTGFITVARKVTSTK